MANESKKFRLVKSFYDQNLWTIGRVADAVFKKWITEEEYLAITGKKYA